MLRNKLEVYKRELETTDFSNSPLFRRNQAYLAIDGSRVSFNISARSVESTNLPFGKTNIMGIDYRHFNVEGSMLDAQFVKTANVIESLYKEVL